MSRVNIHTNIIDLCTGKVYPTIRDAANDLWMTRPAVNHVLNGGIDWVYKKPLHIFWLLKDYKRLGGENLTDDQIKAEVQKRHEAWLRRRGMTPQPRRLLRDYNRKVLVDNEWEYENFYEAAEILGLTASNALEIMYDCALGRREKYKNHVFNFIE